MTANIIYYIRRGNDVQEFSSDQQAEKAWRKLYNDKGKEKDHCNMASRSFHPGILDSDIVAYNDGYKDYEAYELRTSIRPF